ncbi:MAG: porin [Alphaproteobacteria bacterium]|jgi:hypothetical protein|nr:porin [Alphaproteobacteria bacterium]
MKKTVLLASAAVLLAGTAQAADGLKLGLEGNASVYGVYANQDVDKAEFEIKKEMTVNFTGETMLDNGMKVGVAIETNVQEDDNDGEEEAYIYAEGGFGKVIVGKEYNAAYLMQVAAPAVDAELDGMDPTYDVVTDGSNKVDTTSYAMFGDGSSEDAGEDKITYISPVWDGLQVGASYSLGADDDGGDNRAEMSDENNEKMSLAARYAVDDVMGADWVFGAGYNKDVAADSKEWNVGVNAMVDAWDLGVAYYTEEDVTDEVEAIAVGANYTNGDYTYGASYLYKEVGDEDDLERYMAGVNYEYGPGMKLNGSVAYNTYDSDGGRDENDATVVAIGTVINF